MRGGCRARACAGSAPAPVSSPRRPPAPPRSPAPWRSSQRGRRSSPPLPAAGGLYAAIGLPVNPVGLAIADVSARLGAGGDKSLLVVEGALVNLRGEGTAAPNLRIALRAADGRELYVWTTRPPKDRLAAGERVPFAARLAAPPPGVVDALVKFLAPGDKDSLAPEG